MPPRPICWRVFYFRIQELAFTLCHVYVKATQCSVSIPTDNSYVELQSDSDLIYLIVSRCQCKSSLAYHDFFSHYFTACLLPRCIPHEPRRSRPSSVWMLLLIWWLLSHGIFCFLSIDDGLIWRFITFASWCFFWNYLAFVVFPWGFSSVLILLEQL